jgi:hypothetical protein
MTKEEIEKRIYKNPKMALKVLESIKLVDTLEKLPDVDIASLLMKEVWSNMDMLSREACIVEVAIDRLMESKG